jgi:hypothetical protein
LQTGLNELEQPAPFSSIGTFSEILLGDPKTELAQRRNFLGIITREALERVAARVIQTENQSSCRCREETSDQKDSDRR